MLKGEGNEYVHDCINLWYYGLDGEDSRRMMFELSPATLVRLTAGTYKRADCLEIGDVVCADGKESRIIDAEDVIRRASTKVAFELVPRKYTQPVTSWYVELHPEQRVLAHRPVDIRSGPPRELEFILTGFALRGCYDRVEVGQLGADDLILTSCGVMKIRERRRFACIEEFARIIIKDNIPIRILRINYPELIIYGFATGSIPVLLSDYITNDEDTDCHIVHGATSTVPIDESRMTRAALTADVSTQTESRQKHEVCGDSSVSTLLMPNIWWRTATVLLPNIWCLCVKFAAAFLRYTTFPLMSATAAVMKRVT